MAIHVTTMITKFFWKNKILIPCVLFGASFIMLTKIFRHNGSDGSKQPVEYLETIDFPDESERKLGRNQLSWNEMDKGEQNVLFRDIYKDFKQKTTGKLHEDKSYLGVKGEGEVEVVEGYERDAWGARTYDPLSLLQDQGHMEFIDLETIDDYVIKAPETATDTRQHLQPSSWKGSYAIRTEQDDSNAAFPTKRAYDVYEAEVESRYKKKIAEEETLLKKKHIVTGQIRDDLAVQGNDLISFQYPKVEKYGKMKRKGSKKARKQPSETLAVHLENEEQIVVKPQSNQNYEDDDDTSAKVKRMGKKKKRKQLQNQRSLDPLSLSQLSQYGQNPPHGDHDSMPLKFSPITDKKADKNLIPRKIYLPLDSDIAQIKNGNTYIQKQNQLIQNLNPVDSYRTEHADKLSENQKIISNHYNDFPHQHDKKLNNKKQNNSQYEMQFQMQSQRFHNLQQQKPSQRHSNNDHTIHINQNDFLQQHRPKQQQRYWQEHNINEIKQIQRQKSYNVKNVQSDNQSPQQQNLRQKQQYNNQQPNTQKQSVKEEAYHQQRLNVHMYNKPRPTNDRRQTVNTQQITSNQQDKHQQLQYIPIQQKNTLNQLQREGQSYQQQWKRSSQGIAQYSQNLYNDPFVNQRDTIINSKNVPLPSLRSLISQQNLMLDVQREISEQYAHIQQLKSKLAIANYVAKEMVHKPHTVSKDTNKRSTAIKNQTHTNHGSHNTTHGSRSGQREMVIGFKDINVQANVKDKMHDQEFNEAEKQLIGGKHGDGLLHDRMNVKIHNRFGEIVQFSTGQRTDDKNEFKLKHKRKPTFLQNNNQTRVYAFENRFNDSLSAAGNISTYDIYNYTMFPLNSTLDLAGIRQKLQKMTHQTSETGKFMRHLQNTMYRDPSVHLELFSQWFSSKDSMCRDSEVFVAFDDKFARLHNVVIDKQFSVGKDGGENISDVINQAENAEYYKVYKGFWQVYCQSSLHSDSFMGNHHINEWYYALEDTRDPQPADAKVVTDFTIAVVRYEYANLYHTMTDFYNAFIMMEFFNKTQAETNILLIDGHPKSNLDDTWQTLFNSTNRISNLPERTRFTDLVWSIVGYESAMNDHYMMQLPLVEEFRHFFLSTYGVPHDVNGIRNDGHSLNCDSLSVLFIWRRDYVAHPRNPSGFIQRKVQNEQELVTKLRKKFTNYTIRGVQIDLFDMKQQLEFIASTDILIGMHGAGLTHSMFLPKHAGIIELIPNYWSAANMHFEAIATWRNLYFDRWTNEDPGNEAPNYSTTVPPEVVITLIKNMVRPMCNTSIDQTAYHGPGYNNMNNQEDNTQAFRSWNSDEQ